MMNWIDVASVVFVCVTMNHLGLVGAIERLLGRRLPIINCVKCSTFWSVLAYGLWSVGFSDFPLTLATSFLASYVAIWLELLEAYIDTKYLKIYETISTKYPIDEVAPDADDRITDRSVSELRPAEGKKKTKIKDKL